jgi:hypothetical protein
MELKPGTRLESATCDTQVVVVKAPGGELEVRCGGETMRPLGEGGDRLALPPGGEPTLLGKRYADEALGVELLCTHGGEGALSVGDTPLLVKGAKPLPSSD